MSIKNSETPLSNTKVVWNHWLVKTTKHVREIKMLKIYSFWLLHFQLKKPLGNTGRYFLFDFYLILKYFSENLRQRVKQNILQNWTKHLRACEMQLFSLFSVLHWDCRKTPHQLLGFIFFLQHEFPQFSPRTAKTLRLGFNHRPQFQGRPFWQAEWWKSIILCHF